MIKPKKRIAVAILNYNGINHLKKFLPSVVKHSDKKISELYVIDNNSNDESVNFIRKNYPSVNIIQNKKNYGYAKGYNIGLSQIDLKYLVLLNNDDQKPTTKGQPSNSKLGSCFVGLCGWSLNMTFNINTPIGLDESGGMRRITTCEVCAQCGQLVHTPPTCV